MKSNLSPKKQSNKKTSRPKASAKSPVKSRQPVGTKSKKPIGGDKGSAQVETALHESQELFSLFIRYSPIYAFIKTVTSTESRVLHASDNYQEMIGISGRDMVGKTMAELFPSELAAKMTADDWSVVTNGRILKLDEDLNGRNYTSIKFPITLGNKTLLAGYTIDITERKEAEEALRKSEERFRQTLDSMIEGCMIIGFDWKYLYVNEAAARHGHIAKREELINRTINEMYPGIEQSEIFVHYRRCMEERIPQRFESSFTFSDGSVDWYEMSVQPVPEGIFVLSIDITKRKRAETNLQESEERYRSLFNLMDEGLAMNEAVLDENGEVIDYIILSVNPAFEKQTPYKAEQFLGKRATDVYKMSSEYIRDWWKSHSQMQEAAHTEMYHEPSGRWFYVTATPPKEKRFATIFTDITQRKKAETKLLHVNRLYATISQINQTIVRAPDRDTLFSEICRVAIEHGKFRMAWIGLINKTGEGIKPAVFAGEEQGYLKNLNIAIQDPKLGRGPTGTAIREGRCVICQDIANDPRMAPWREQALQRGYRSSAAVPIRQKNRFVGALTVYASDAQAFSDEDQNLLNEIGQDISYALDSMEAETERKQMEAALHESSKRFRSLFENAPVGVLLADQQGNILEVNPTALQILGSPSADETRKINILNFQPLVKAGISADFQECVQTGLARSTEHPYLTKWGKSIDLNMRFTPLLKAQGETTLVQILLEDITERKQAEEAIRQANLYNRRLIEASLDPVVTISPSGKITDVNTSTENITGFKRRELIGTDFSDYFTEPENARNGYKKVFHDGSVRDYPLEIRHRDGRTTSVLYNATLYNDDKGNIIGIFAAARDVTDRKQAEEKLRLTLEEKETLLREVHHRVKNNLQAMIALMDMQSKLIPDETSRSFLKELEGQARTMSLVYEQLYQSENLARVDMSSYITQLTSNVLETFGKNRSLELKLNARLVLDVAEAMPCGLIINELFTNILKYAFPPDFKDQPIVTIDLHQEKQNCHLTVSDNGIGLPSGFDLRSTRTLGLRLVNLWATHQLGGTLEVTKEPGATFSIIFETEPQR